MRTAPEGLRARITPPSHSADGGVVHVRIDGSKHQFIYIFLASLMFTRKTITLRNVPDIVDTYFLVDYATAAGAKVTYDRNRQIIVVRQGGSKYQQYRGHS